MPPSPAHPSDPQQMPIPAAKHTEIGNVIAIIIVIFVIIMGGIYFWGKTLNAQPTNQPAYIPNGTNINVNATKP